MLAPTRELVAGSTNAPGTIASPAQPRSQEIELGDGNGASVGDLIITRANDRRLRITATDWVKNGDRWTILNLTGTVVRVRHSTETAAPSRLPADYVSTATGWVTPPLCIPRKA